MVQKTSPAKIRANDKVEVKKVITDFMEALCKKNLKDMLSHYANELIVYDVKPPFQTKGAIAWKHTWEACIDYFPAVFGTEIRDLHVHVSGDLALAHYLFRLTGPEVEHSAMQTWIRTTTGFRKQHSKWKIIHEHGSLPFNPHTLQAIFTLDPDNPMPENRMKPVEECRTQLNP
jgi:ketosteroid isomerase-like protein